MFKTGVTLSPFQGPVLLERGFFFNGEGLHKCVMLLGLAGVADGGQQAARHRGGGGDHPHQGGLRPRAAPHHREGGPEEAGRRQPIDTGGGRAGQR